VDGVFEALAHPMRRRIVDVLKREGELAAGDLSDRFSLPKPTMSHHLGVLVAAGLIDRERRGRNLYYRINQSVIEEALGVVLELLSFDRRLALRLGKRPT
jgi:DNA-binding transcriptional ArsR family regulator